MCALLAAEYRTDRASHTRARCSARTRSHFLLQLEQRCVYDVKALGSSSVRRVKALGHEFQVLAEGPADPAESGQDKQVR